MKISPTVLQINIVKLCNYPAEVLVQYYRAEREGSVASRMGELGQRGGYLSQYLWIPGGFLTHL